MEKEMLAIARIKSGEGKFEKFMGFMQSDEGMAVRKTIAHVEKTVPGMAPDKIATSKSKKSCVGQASQGRPAKCKLH